MLTIKRQILLFAALVCLLAGCTSVKELGRTLGNLSVVQSELIKRFGEKEVNVRANSFNGRIGILVTFVNSPLNEKATAERFARARETADVVKSFYPEIKNVSQIAVGFAESKTALVFFHSTRVLNFFLFDNQGKSLDQPSTVSEPSSIDPSAPLTRYIPSENRTDISSQGILLEGTPEKGLTLLPHFSVGGNVNGTSAKPPSEVSFDFASYAEKPKFPSVTKISFITDDRVTYRTDGQFSTSKLSDGTYTEFLYLKVPTKEFIKIMTGNRVSLKLEQHIYELDDRCVLQLQRMSDFLR